MSRPETFTNRCRRKRGKRAPYFRKEKVVKIALYTRVSRNDGTQDAGNQADELRAWAQRLGGTIVAEYVDQASGTKSAAARPGLAAALDGAHRRDYDVLLLWSLDRLSRNGVVETVSLLRRLQASGVAVRSLRESWLNTSDPHVAELLLSIMAWLAKSEREQLIARTKAGMARAKRRGIHVGRPKLEISAERARLAVERAGSIRGAAKLLRCDEGTIRNRLAS
jgi:DNA invertase Pin-like site-specific DNA recombinase